MSFSQKCHVIRLGYFVNFASIGHLVTAMLTGNCNKPEHMIMANLVNILKKLLTLLNDNEQEKIHMIPGPHTTTIPITE